MCRQYDLDSPPDNAFFAGSRVVIMNCLGSHAEVIMKQAYELDMTGTGWAWIGTDGITVGVSPQHG